MKSISNCILTGKKRGATLRIGNVTINAPSILKHEEELEPLAVAIPTDPDERKKYVSRSFVHPCFVHHSLTHPSIY